ncbi:MAG: 4-hydroxy-3-methylbut-2-en-1-yl diphosphate synthase [Chloroflexota bacterium]|nr:MAG: 4-hydroxy-3-methylbut-2-en-1-yl diphosphate synthase [Chloroflexota bacterium]
MTTANLRYCQTPFVRTRRETRVVMVGNVGVGGANPIRIQSMTTTRTLDTEATVEQVIRLVQAGCEIARITAPTVADARNLGRIRDELHRRGIRIPLVADIHFSPAAALEAARHVEKVRINPGNYADSKAFATREYSDAEYAAELTRIEERFAPVVLRCKERGIAMRIGTNHGSLSDRIMNRHGDTPLGMVESALEFLSICEKCGYHDVIFSMKASNPKVMIQAYRLLAARLDAMGKPYPLHLGVTEAGDGEDGRAKSAVGIGSLLADGIGDTIRVSLTEEPEAEVPVAARLATRYRDGGLRGATPANPPYDPFTFERRATHRARLGSQIVGGDETPRVIVRLPSETLADESAASVRRVLAPTSRHAPRPDIIAISIADEADLTRAIAFRRDLRRSGIETPVLGEVVGASISPAALVGNLEAVCVTFDRAEEWLAAGALPVFVAADCDDAGPSRGVEAVRDAIERRPREKAVAGVVLYARSTDGLIRAIRYAAAALPGLPLIGAIVPRGDDLDKLLDASIGVGGPLCDGIGDGVLTSDPDIAASTRMAFNVLQAASARVSKTEYVACPSCGRTLFDLQSTTARIRASTDHLVGVKIAIMGCVVNGPGEMADADFGYVGGSPGQVNLYVGRQCVERGVPETEADSRLVALIRDRGRWVEPE